MTSLSNFLGLDICFDREANSTDFPIRRPEPGTCDMQPQFCLSISSLVAFTVGFSAEILDDSIFIAEVDPYVCYESGQLKRSLRMFNPTLCLQGSS